MTVREENPLDNDGAGQPRTAAGALTRRLFVYPMLVAGGCVLAFVLVRWMTHDPRTTQELLTEVRNAEGRTRWQAAHELAQRITADAALRSDPRLGRQMTDLFAAARTDDPQVAGYVAGMLGLMAPEGVAKALVAGLDSDDASLRIQAALALAEVGAGESVPDLAPLLADKDGGVRKAAIYAVGRLGGDGAVELLVPLLQDREADVRWNAALGLASLASRHRVGGSDAGADVLRQMLDRGYLSEVSARKRAQGGRGMTGSEVSNVMINAIRAVAQLAHTNLVLDGTAPVRHGTEFRDVLERLRDRDESPRVQEAARLALSRTEGQ